MWTFSWQVISDRIEIVQPCAMRLNSQYHSSIWCFVWVALHHPCSSFFNKPTALRRNRVGPPLSCFSFQFLCVITLLILSFWCLFRQWCLFSYVIIIIIINSETKIIPHISCLLFPVLMMDCFIYYNQISPGFSCTFFPHLV